MVADRLQLYPKTSTASNGIPTLKTRSVDHSASRRVPLRVLGSASLRDASAPAELCLSGGLVREAERL